ncbi:MAG: ribonuclease VapC [Nitrososphaerota archaeon]|nr:ribonuclease VapC [Aigarchaeota archaeon]MDW8076985.1 ribonuclease VapC [Nitrososphaerota archaeon]
MREDLRSASTKNHNKSTLYILDSTALIAGQTDFSRKEFATTPSVLSEVMHDESVKNVVEIAIDCGQLEVSSPSEASVMEVEKIATSTGDRNKLSRTDIEILALALEKKRAGMNIVIISDDYSIQNLARSMNIKVVGVIHPGIRKQITWVTYCPVCRSEYGISDLNVCTKCGAELKRKPAKR